MLWDKKEKRIVNNSEDDICEMWTGVFKPLAKHPVDLFPEDLKEVQATLSQEIYDDVNNGVYEAGFASSQSAYEAAFTKLFNRLELLHRDPCLLAQGLDLVPALLDFRLDN